MGLLRRALIGLLTAATSLCLAYALFGAGFVVCTTPQATQMVGGTFSGWEDSTFSEDDMAKIAEAVRSFSIEGTSTAELAQTIEDVLASEMPQVAEALAAATSDEGDQDVDVGGVSLARLEELYSMPQDALSHLRDCTPVFTTGRISTGVVGAFGVVGLAALWLLAGRKRAGRACKLASLLVIGVLVALGAWAALDFDGLFAWMHSLFFAQGTWTFDAQSLLIQLFPEAFWAAMALLWVVSSLVFSTLLGIVGRLLSR